jgi:hypothetical protein
MDDGKWIAIMMVGVVFTMFTPLCIMEYSKYQCRIEAIKAGVEADKINTACGLK